MDIFLLVVAAGVFWGLPGYLVKRANRATRSVSVSWAAFCVGVGLIFMLAAVLLRPIFGQGVAAIVEPFAYAGSFIGPWLAYIIFLRLHQPRRINDPRIRINEFVTETPGQSLKYALAVKVSTAGAADLAEQMRLVAVELLHWKGVRGLGCERIMFVVLAEEKAHQEIKQAIAATHSADKWPGPFMRSLVNTVALLDGDGAPVEEYQLVAA